MTVFTKENPIIYNEAKDVYRAFTDMIDRFGSGSFENIVYDDDNGVIEYDIYGKHIRKYFDMDQAPPEIAADLMQWLFSMLDSIAADI